MNVTGTVWLGTTLECCQCHNHKYDPFTQRDYYRFFAFFNNTPKETNSSRKARPPSTLAGPEIVLPADPTTQERRAETGARRLQIAAELAQCLADEQAGLAAWERDMSDADKAENAKLPANIRKLLAIEPAKRGENQREAIGNLLYQHARHRRARCRARWTSLDKQLEALAAATSLVMSEMAEPRMTAIFERGSFLSPGEKVEPGTPRMLPPLAGDEPPRIALDWLSGSSIRRIRWLPACR